MKKQYILLYYSDNYWLFNFTTSLFENIFKPYQRKSRVYTYDNITIELRTIEHRDFGFGREKISTHYIDSVDYLLEVLKSLKLNILQETIDKTLIDYI